MNIFKQAVTILAIFAAVQSTNAQTEAPSNAKPISVKLKKFRDSNSPKDFVNKKDEFDKKNCEIVSYDMYVKRVGTKPVLMTDEEYVKRAKQSVAPNSRFYFVNIKAKCKDDATIYDLSDIVIDIK